MPRRKKGGSWDEGPDGFPPATDTGYGQYSVANTPGSSQFHSRLSWADVTGKDISTGVTINKDLIFQNMQEMFGGRIEANIIHLILEENQWKVDESVDKLTMMASDIERQEAHQRLSSHGRAYSQPEAIPGSQQSRLPERRARTSESGGSLTMLSPKTPSQIGVSYPEMFSNINNSSASGNKPGGGMGAFDSYGMGYSSNFESGAQLAFDINKHGLQSTVNAEPFHSNLDYSQDARMLHTGQGVTYTRNTNPIYELAQPRTTQYSGMPVFTAFSTDTARHVSSPRESSTVMNIKETPPTNTNNQSNSNDNSKSKLACTQQEQKDRAKKRGRKITFSLNPDEREALESLIGDVIVGIGDGVIDSEESTSSENESEEESKTPTETVIREAFAVSPEVESDRVDFRSKTEKHNLKESKQQQKTVTSKDGVKKDSKATNEQGQKVYPPQLKVAVKHMKNLPPRFLRKIQTNKDEESDGRGGKLTEKHHRIQEVPEPPEPPKPVEILSKPKESPVSLVMRERDMRAYKSKEEQKIEKKKKVRGMLDTLDVYFEQSSGHVVEDRKSVENQYQGGEVAIIAPYNESPYLGEKTTHSAPASTQVSPNTHVQDVKSNLDMGHVDPAIKAQGPPMASLQHLIHQAPPPLPQVSGQAMHQKPPGVPESPGINCEELEREMFQSTVEREQNHRLQQLLHNAPQQSAVRNIVVNQSHNMSSSVTQPSQTVIPPQTQFAHSPPMKPPTVSMQQQVAINQQAAMYQQAVQNQYNTSQASMFAGQSNPHRNQYGQLIQMNHPVRMPFGLQLQHQHKSQFSVDAPEFIPRTFTPNMPGQVVASINSQAIHQQQQQQQQQALNHPMYVTNMNSQGVVPGVPSSQQVLVPGLVSSVTSQVQGLSLNPQTLQGPPPQSSAQMQMPTEGFTAPPPPLPQSIPVSMGVMSPQVTTTMAGLAPSQDQLATALGRSSPIPSGAVAPAFMIPKVSQTVGAHPGIAAPGMGMVYAPVYPSYPTGIHPSQYQIHPGPFLVQAWPGGRKEKFHTNLIHHSHPATQKQLSGMVTKLRSGGGTLHVKGTASPKIPHRGQNEMSPQQAKEKVQMLMTQGKKVMVILRGLPGSGKSTIAREARFDGVVLSTDEFFTHNGIYVHDATKLTDAHEWNHKRAKEAVGKGTNPVVIDNTHTQAWEMRAYVSLALKHDYHIEIVEPNTVWKFKVKELAQKNSHEVPLETVQKMYERYEKQVTIERIMGVPDKRRDDSQHPFAEQPDGEGDEKKPRKRRRRRRRRKKKQLDELGSDSEKEDNSSDEDVPEKPDKISSSQIVSDDTTENEMDKSSVTQFEGSEKIAMSSSSIDSEEPPPTAEVGTCKSTLRTVVDNQGTALGLPKHMDAKGTSVPNTGGATAVNETMERNEADLSIHEDATHATELNTSTSTVVKETEEQIACDAAISESCQQQNVKNGANNSQETFAVDGSPIILAQQVDGCVDAQSSTATTKYAQQDLEWENFETHKCESSLQLNSEGDQHSESGSECGSSDSDSGAVPEGLEIVSQHLVGQLDKEEVIAAKVKIALRLEIEHFVREQIVDSLLNEELPKITDNVIGDNGAVVSQTDIDFKINKLENCPLMDSVNTFDGDCAFETETNLNMKCRYGEEIAIRNITYTGLGNLVDDLTTEEASMCYMKHGTTLVDRYSVAATGTSPAFQDASVTPFFLRTDIGEVVANGGEVVANDVEVVAVGLDDEPKTQRICRTWEKESGDDLADHGVWQILETVPEPTFAVCDDLQPTDSVPTEAVTITDPANNVTEELGGEHTADEINDQENDNVNSVQCCEIVEDDGKTIEPLTIDGVPKNKEMLKTDSLGHTSETVACKSRDTDKNWKAVLPKFSTDISQSQCLNLVDSCNEKCFADVQTFTDSTEVAIAEKLMYGSHDPGQPIDFSVVNAVSRDINVNCKYEDVQCSRSPLSPSLYPKRDQASMTDTYDESEHKQVVVLLKRCFPDAESEYLEHIVGQCENDTQWAVNMLLDAGYEYKIDHHSEPTIASHIDSSGAIETTEKPLPNESLFVCEPRAGDLEILRSVDVRPKQIRIEHGSEDDDDDDSPPSLFVLCHQSLSSNSDVAGDTVCTAMAAGGVKRLCSIDEFKQHLTSPEVKAPEKPRPPFYQTSNRNTNAGIFDDIEQLLNPKLENLLSAKLQQLHDTANPFLNHNVDINLDDGLEEGKVSEDSGKSSRQSDELEVDECIDTMLTLTPELAQQLIDLFGPIGFHISTDSMFGDDLMKVRLNRKTAKQIHNRWSLTLKQKFALEEAAIDKMTRDDEYLARILQAEEDCHDNATSQTPTNTEWQTVTRSKKSPTKLLHETTSRDLDKPPAPPCESLMSIMNEQYEEQAIKESRRDYESRSSTSPERHLATRLKKQQLYEDYPLMDTPVIDDIFEATGYSLVKTKETIEECYGKKEPVKNVMTEEAKERMEEDLVRKALIASMQEQWLGEENYDTPDGYQQLDSADYNHLRQEASMYYKLRHEAFQKAQEAYRRGLKPLASWYSQVGQLHSKKLKEANKRAAEMIVQHRSSVLGANVIDLHGLHVDEALRVLKQELELRESERLERPEMRKKLKLLSVVTGRGKHSQGGQARLRPNVITWLEQHDYRYNEPTVGKLDIALK